MNKQIGWRMQKVLDVFQSTEWVSGRAVSRALVWTASEQLAALVAKRLLDRRQADHYHPESPIRAPGYEYRRRHVAEGA